MLLLVLHKVELEYVVDFPTSIYHKLDLCVLDFTACLAFTERTPGEQREVAHRRAAGCPSRAGRLPAEGTSSQRGDEPHCRQQRDSHSGHRCTLHGEQVGLPGRSLVVFLVYPKKKQNV